MPAPRLEPMTLSQLDSEHRQARIDGRLLVMSPLNGSDKDYVAAYEMDANGRTHVFAVESNIVKSMWLVDSPEQAVAFVLTKNGWGMVLSGKWRVK